MMERYKERHKESYIDSSIEDPKGLPKNVIAILEMLHDYDKEGNWGLYYDRLDDLCVITKNAIGAHAMTEKDWDVIVKKYWVHADIVFDKEEKNEIV